MRKKMWHCKSCGRVCDSSNTVCPDCGLDLGFYGEIQFVETGEPEPSSPSGSQPKEQAKPAVEEESRPKPEKERKVKERKPEKRGKGGIVLVLVVVVLLAVLGLGGILTMRKADELRFDKARGEQWETSDYKTYYAESGSKATQEIGVSYTGLWGPWQELTVTSSDSNVVKVISVEEDIDLSNESFPISTVRLKAGEPGTAEITAKVGNESVSYQVQVYQVTGVELDVPEGFEVEEGIVLGLEDSVGYTARLQYAGEIGDEKWLPKLEVFSSDTDIVEVDSETGKLIAKGYGTARITASAGDYRTSIPVNVYDVTGVELECYDLLADGNGNTLYWIPEGLTMGCDLTYHYNGPALSGISYTLESSNEKVISVDLYDNTITAVGPGTATITYTKGSVSDSVTLEVYPVDRSTGSWVECSIRTIAAPAEDSSSKADYMIITHRSDDVLYSTISTHFGAGRSFSYTTDWEEAEGRDGAWACGATVTLQGSKWDQRRSIAGITFLFKRNSSDSGDYDPATDLLDYWVIYTE